MNCEICGKDEVIGKAKIEETIFDVCNNCVKYGKIIRNENNSQIRKKFYIKKEEPEEFIIQGFGIIVRNAREKLGMSQDDFAKKINEKHSVIHSIESQEREPEISLARKIEKALNIKLVQKEIIKKDEKEEEHNKTDEFTLGDFIKKKN